jgi:hypothetical protein
MKKSVLLVTVMVALAVVASGAQAGQAPQDPKKDQKAASIAGNWNMLVNGPQGPMNISMVLSQDGKKLTGTLSSQMGDTTLEGEYTEGKISFWITFDAGGGSSQIAFAGVLKEDGTLEGTLSGQMGDMTWTAERAK